MFDSGTNWKLEVQLYVPERETIQMSVRAALGSCEGGFHQGAIKDQSLFLLAYSVPVSHSNSQFDTHSKNRNANSIATYSQSWTKDK